MVHEDTPMDESMTDSLVFDMLPYKEVHLLNPSFWQALGRHEGWPFSEYDEIGKWHPEDWRTKWHSFIDHIISGGTPDSFFDGILKGGISS